MEACLRNELVGNEETTCPLTEVKDASWIRRRWIRPHSELNIESIMSTAIALVHLPCRKNPEHRVQTAEKRDATLVKYSGNNV